jgi:hypothetical protein
MKIPLISRIVTARRHESQGRAHLHVIPAGATADRVGAKSATPPANDARATPLPGRAPLLRGHGCPCLTRLSDQSGEIRSDGRRRAGERTLAPARPLTGIFTPPASPPPKVIVSDLLLNLGIANVDVLLDEVELPPAPPAPPPAAPKETLTGVAPIIRGSSAVRLQGGRMLRPTSGSPQIPVIRRRAG